MCVQSKFRGDSMEISNEMATFQDSRKQLISLKNFHVSIDFTLAMLGQAFSSAWIFGCFSHFSKHPQISIFHFSIFHQFTTFSILVLSLLPDNGSAIMAMMLEHHKSNCESIAFQFEGIQVASEETQEKKLTKQCPLPGLPDIETVNSQTGRLWLVRHYC